MNRTEFKNFMDWNLVMLKLIFSIYYLVSINHCNVGIQKLQKFSCLNLTNMWNYEVLFLDLKSKLHQKICNPPISCAQTGLYILTFSIAQSELLLVYCFMAASKLFRTYRNTKNNTVLSIHLYKNVYAKFHYNIAKHAEIVQ